MNLRYCEKKEFDFQYIEEDCDQWHRDKFDDIVCEVGENDGGQCYPWECPQCYFVGEVEGNNYIPLIGMEIIELVVKVKEVVYEQ